MWMLPKYGISGGILMTDEEYRKRLQQIYLRYGNDLKNADERRNLSIKLLNDEYNKTRGK